jgi:hypothetical protein
MGLVDTNDMTGAADLPRRQQAVETGAAAEIDDGLAGCRAAIACGLPQPSPRFAPSRTAASSAAE